MVKKAVILCLLAVVSLAGVWFAYKYWYPPVFRLTDQDIGSKAVVETNLGKIEIELSTKSPFAVSQFTRLSRIGFYDGTQIHRIVPDLLIEGGDPLTKDKGLRNLWGEGGSASSFKNEIHPGDRILAGTLVMAGSDHGTYGSHFYIVTRDTKWMVGKHTIIGQVKSGMEVILKIEKTPISTTGMPLEDIVISKITVL